MLRRTFLAATTSLLATVGASNIATAADLDGKTIEWWVPFSEGGGTDRLVRSLVGWSDQFLAGDQTMVVRNKVGGSGVASANAYAKADTDDGLTILATSGSLQVPYLLGDPLVEYEYQDWTALFAIPVGGVVYVPASLGVSGPEDLAKLQAADINFGAISPTSLDIVPLLAWEILNVDANVVFGMQSRKNTRLSTMRGETNLDYQTTPSYLRDVSPLVDEGQMVPLFTWGMLNAEGEVVRDPTFPDMMSFPEFVEAATGSAPSGPAYDAWKGFFAAGFAFQKFLVMPKDAPADVISTYRTAMADMVKDPNFVEDMAPKLGAYAPIVGDDLEPALQAAITVPEEARNWMKDWIKVNYNVDL